MTISFLVWFAGECGSAMSAHQIHGLGHRRLDGTEKYKRSGYRCKKCFDQRACHNKKILYETTLEKYLISHLREDLLQYIAETEIKSAPIVNITAKKKKIEDKIEKLKDLYVNDLITLDEFKVDRAKYLEQLKPCRSANLLKDVTHLKRLVESDIEEIYKTFTFADKVEFWRSILHEVRFYADRTIKPIFA